MVALGRLVKVGVFDEVDDERADGPALGVGLHRRQASGADHRADGIERGQVLGEAVERQARGAVVQGPGRDRAVVWVEAQLGGRSYRGYSQVILLRIFMISRNSGGAR